MNPLLWKREHLVIWALLIVAGGAAGFVMGWFASPFSRVPGWQLGDIFLVWLHYPEAWWPWALGGAVTAGLAYYSGDLLTGAR